MSNDPNTTPAGQTGPKETEAQGIERIKKELAGLNRKHDRLLAIQKDHEAQRAAWQQAEADLKSQNAALVERLKTTHTSELEALRKQLDRAKEDLAAAAEASKFKGDFLAVQATLEAWLKAHEVPLREAQLLKKHVESGSMKAPEILALLVRWTEKLAKDLSEKRTKFAELEQRVIEQGRAVGEANRLRLDAESKARAAEQSKLTAVAAATTRAANAESLAQGLQTTLGEVRQQLGRATTELTRARSAADSAKGEFEKQLRAAKKAKSEAEEARASAERGLARANQLLGDDKREAARVPGLLLDVSRLHGEKQALSEQLASAKAGLERVDGETREAKAAAARLQTRVTELEAAASAIKAELPHESALRELLRPGPGVAARFKAQLEQWAADSQAYAMAGQTLLVMKDGPALVSGCFKAIHAAYLANQEQRPLAAEQSALLELVDPLVNFLIEAIRTNSHHVGFYLQLGEEARAWLIGNLDYETTRYLVGISLTGSMNKRLVHTVAIKRVLHSLPAPTRAALIASEADATERRQFFRNHPALKAAVVALDGAVRSQPIKHRDDKDPSFLRAHRAILASDAGRADVYAAAREAMDVLYYLPEHLVRELWEDIAKDQQAVAGAIAAYGYDPFLPLMLLDVSRQHLVTGLGRDITNVGPFMALADLRDPRVPAKCLDGVRELLNQVGQAFGDVAARGIVISNIRRQTDLCLGRFHLN